LSDGRQFTLGTREEVADALDQITLATGGSSGGGKWSRLFGFSLDLELPVAELEGLKWEAADFLAAAELLVGREAKQLLRSLSAL